MGAGYSLVVDYGLGGDSNLRIESCEVNNFAFTPKEGGTVELTFRVQITDLDERILGKLAGLCQHEVHIVLTAPIPVDAPDAPMENPFLNPIRDDDAPLTEADVFPGAMQTPESALAAALAE